MTPLERVLSRLPHAKERPDGGWSARCPAHDGKGETSLSIDVGDNQPVVLNCFAGCSYETILRALGLDPKDVRPERERTSQGKQTSGGKRPITLEELARDKALSMKFLASLGLHDLPGGGVGIPYYNEEGIEQHVKQRTALKATEGSFWPRGQPLMPYGLEDTAHALEEGYLVVPEGESDAWTLRFHGFPCLAIPGASAVGCLTAEHVEDISTLYLIQEPDRGGEQFIAGMARRLRKIGWTGEAYVIGLDSAKDPNELHKRSPDGFKTTFQAAMDQAERLSSEEAPDEWPEPIPFDAPVTLPPFPLDALPKPIAAYVQEVAATRQVPIDLPAMLSQGTVSAAAGKRFRVQIGNTHSEPLNLYEAVAMEPGSRKSAVYADMIEPLEAYEQELQASKALEITRATETRAIEEGRLRSLREQAVKAKTPAERDLARQEALQLASNLTTIPLEPRLVAGDITPEKLANLLFEQGGRIAVMDAEAGGVFEIMAGRYTHDGKANLDIYLRGHAGDTLRVDRLGRTAEHVQNPCLTVVLAPQPEVIRALADQPGFRGRGLLGRFLYSLPESLVGSRKYQDRPINPGARATYREVIRAILQRPEAKTPDGKASHHVLSLKGQALEVWAEHANEIEAAQAEGGELAGIRDWASKLAGAVARIAGGLHLAQHYKRTEPWKIPISTTTILAAWAIGDYLKVHALATYAIMGADPNVSLAQRLLRWIERHQPKEFSLRDCHQHHRHVVKPDDLLPALDILEGRGFIRRLSSPQSSGPGRRPSPTFEVNPNLRTSTQNSQKSQKRSPSPLL